jgi:electron transfer flavoprotein alpha subunit
MSTIVIYAETAQGSLKKNALEAASYAHQLAALTGGSVAAIAIGDAPDAELQKLAGYGVTKVLKVTHERLATFNEAAYSSAFAAAAQQLGAQHVVMGQTYNARPMAARLAIKLGAALFSGVSGLAQLDGGAVVAQRSVYSTKGIQYLKTTAAKVIFTVKPNSIAVQPKDTSLSIEAFAYTPADKDFACVATGVEKASDKISLTEADVVVSAGRGLKGPEHWGMVEELAEVLGAATACSKPVADIGWRPHHEHVGQTGIQIAPNLYIAIGISGAIQHLAGVNSSKTIVAINKDPEAPFFKAADFGIVGDAFEVVPKLLEAVKNVKRG